MKTLRTQLHALDLCLAPQLAELTQCPGFVAFSTIVPMDKAQAEDFLAARLSLFQDGYGAWMVFREQQPVGWVQLLRQRLDDGRILPELGYRFRSSHQGQGLAFEAASWARDYAFRELSLQLLYAFIAPDNGPSQKLAGRLGFAAGPRARFKGFEVDLWSLESKS
jgi:RimJ/RimL family protein N-acetyltransferase